jgi:acyl carrier protein
MNRDEAMTMIRETLAVAVPGADPRDLAPDDIIRDVLEIDSLDFLSFVETLSARAEVTIDEEDYNRFDTLANGAEFLIARHAEPVW